MENFSTAEDCRQTLAAVMQMGLDCSHEGNSVLVKGRPPSWAKGNYIVDAGNSGTTARLLMGLAGHLAPGGSLTIVGDKSLSQRPMERVALYLRPMGIRVEYLAQPDRLPLRLDRPGDIFGLSQNITVPSAQVKSAVLLAGLAAGGVTELLQQPQTRDHTELMLEAMGADIHSQGHLISLRGGPLQMPPNWLIPGDFSGAAWWMALAAVSGQVSLNSVGVNPTRTGFAQILSAMGANITFRNCRSANCEPVGDLLITQGDLQGVEIGPETVPLCVDELPALAVVAAFARGKTVVRGAAELKFKESNRLEAIGMILSAFGAEYSLLRDGFVVRGRAKLHAAQVSSVDHRIVMAASIMAALVPGESRIGDSRWLGVSYPNFPEQFNQVTKSLSSWEK